MCTLYYPNNIKYLFCWQIFVVSGQSLASNGPVADSRDLIHLFMYSPFEAETIDFFLSSLHLQGSISYDHMDLITL